MAEKGHQKLPQSAGHTDDGSDIKHSADVDIERDNDAHAEGGPQDAHASAIVAALGPKGADPQEHGYDFARYIKDAGGSARAADALSAMVQAGYSLGAWAARYLATKVCGGPKKTLEAKSADLAAFAAFFARRHGHGDIEAWCEADTRYFLREMTDAGKSPATINRVLYTLKHFARFVHEQPGALLARHGVPTRDIKPVHVDEPECKKLSLAEQRALFEVARAAAAAQKGRVATEATRCRPCRDLAILGVLLYTGLRVSELVALTRRQYDGDALYDVKRKGGRTQRKVYLLPNCTRLLDAYLSDEREFDAQEAGANTSVSQACAPLYRVDASRPLFLSARTGGAMDRRRIGRMLEALAKKASEHLGQAFHVHPHQLRHTFGARFREASGSDTETAAALAHGSLRHVPRYTRKTDDERGDIYRKAFAGDTPTERDA